MARRNDHSRDELTALTIKISRKIVKKEGFSKLTARRIAEEIGYTPGTLYNMFGSMDGLYFAVNAQTLDEMLHALSSHENYPPKADLVSRLKRMAEIYMDFARENKQLWLMVFMHSLPKGEKSPEWYREKVASLFLPLEELLIPLFTKNNKKDCSLAARVLWSSVHGICFMAQTEKTPLISNHGSVAMSEYLIDNFVSGLKNNARKKS